MTNFVKQHLGEAVIGVEVIPCGELQPTGPIGRRKHERTATNVQIQTRRCGQPDDLTRIHVPRHDRALVLGIVLVSVIHAHRISLFGSWRTLFTPNPVQPIAPAGTACGVSMGVGGPPSLAAGVTAGSGSVWTARPVCPSHRNWTACAAVHAVARPITRSRSARGTLLSGNTPTASFASMDDGMYVEATGSVAAWSLRRGLGLAKRVPATRGR